MLCKFQILLKNEEIVRGIQDWFREILGFWRGVSNIMIVFIYLIKQSVALSLSCST